MKRAAWIVGIVLALAVAVGAFVIGGSDGSSEAKSPNTSISDDNSTKSGANQISGATKVQSLPPLKPAKSDDDDDDEDDDDDDQDSYETRKPFVGVSPRRVQVGKELELQVRGFKPGETVTVSLGNSNWIDLKTDKQGRAKKKVKAPAEGTYLVQAKGLESLRVATADLKVVKKR
jgi:hypothetical protein